MSAATLPLLLKSLYLPTVAREYAGVAAQATREGLSHEAYVHALATQELSERAARRTERLLVESKLPREKSLASFDLTRLPAPVPCPHGRGDPSRRRVPRAGHQRHRVRPSRHR